VQPVLNVQAPTVRPVFSNVKLLAMIAMVWGITCMVVLVNMMLTVLLICAITLQRKCVCLIALYLNQVDLT
jgi:hypothetical protein